MEATHLQEPRRRLAALHSSTQDDRDQHRQHEAAVARSRVLAGLGSNPGLIPDVWSLGFHGRRKEK